MSDVNKIKDQIEYFLDATHNARILSQRDRDYYSGYQWSEQELSELNRRKQAPITVNRIKPKIEGLKGLLQMRKTDIKAFPRNSDDEEAAHAITDALRYIEDNNDYDITDADVFEDMVVEGYGAVIVDVLKDSKGENNIIISRIPWDRFYYDPHSIKKDFTDARYLGQMLWLDEDQIKDLFGNRVKLEDLSKHYDANHGYDDTFEDKPRYWISQEQGRTRYRVAQHFYLQKNQWRVAYVSGTTYLEKPQLSPYIGEDGQPSCPIIGQSCYIDRENQRYGEARAFIDLQKEINHRRSKALHLLSSRQTAAPRGAVENVDALKRELAKPNGHVEYNGQARDFEVLPTNDFTQGQLNLYLDAKQELDAQSMNAQLSGERSSGDLSGKAIDRLQSAGSLEVSSIFSSHNSFKKRVFRQAYAMIKQYWDKPKWIRVTDDQDNLKFTGLNHEVTVQEFLENIINDESRGEAERKGAAFEFTRLMQEQSPVLQEIVEVKNKVAELDVDIIIEESADIVNIQQEQFATLAQFAQGRPEIALEDLIALSNLRNKDELIEKIETRKQEAIQAAGGAAQMEAQTAEVNNAKTFAEAQLAEKRAEQLAIENATLVTRPDESPQVNA
jgi:hypothetical protein